MKEIKNIKPSVTLLKVTIDKSLDTYANKNLFPKKLEKANKMLGKLKIPLPA